ncbi:MAG: transcriptional repressor [Actinobacteria bacterium]|nr:MAG: transcriptional repressor [Actinomycetota bacterium]
MIIDLTQWYRMCVASTVQELLTSRGIRPTRQRVQVLEALASEPNDATAQGIFEALRSRGEPIGLATVYRALGLLSEQGVVDALMHHPGEVCYRLCGDGHHHHLICSECHQVVELGDCELEPWLERLSGAHGFTVTGHAVEVTGVCADCAPA